MKLGLRIAMPGRGPNGGSRHAAAVVLLALSSGCRHAPPADLPAGVTALGPVVTAQSDKYRFESGTVGQPFIIEVVRVDSALARPALDARLPVVFVTDGGLHSTLVPAMVRSGSFDLFPSMIVVSIGHDLTGLASTDATVMSSARRATDFTSMVDDNYLAGVVSATEVLFKRQWPKEGRLGGAAAFLAFIDTELKPFIAARYPVDSGDATLVGHSLGGLFTLHVLFTSPGSFQRYVALSPAANYANELLFREEAAFTDAPVRVFMGVGGRDSPEILATTPRLHAQITAHTRAGLRYTYRLFPDETHSSVVPGGLMSGLRAVFDPPALPALGPPEDAK